WQALQHGQLLGPSQMAQMHDTTLAETFQDIIPGLSYGLGIFWIPSRCGGFWAHPGDLPGVSTYSGASTDGSRATAIYLTTKLADSATSGAVTERALQLMEDVICGTD